MHDIVNVPIISVGSRRVLGRLMRFQAGSAMVPGGFRMGSGRVSARFKRGSGNGAVPGVPGFTDTRQHFLMIIISNLFPSFYPTRQTRMVTAG